jgi:hypothetical protein
MPGSRLIEAAAPASTNDFHSSIDFGWMFQFGLSGAPMSLRISALTVVGVGRARAGISPRPVVSAAPGG